PMRMRIAPLRSSSRTEPLTNSESFATKSSPSERTHGGLGHERRSTMGRPLANVRGGTQQISGACRYHASASQTGSQVQSGSSEVRRDRVHVERARPAIRKEQAISMNTTKLSVYDGRQIIAVVEQRKDGWHLIVRNRHIGVCADRESALRLVNTTINPPIAVRNVIPHNARARTCRKIPYRRTHWRNSRSQLRSWM